jgi:hypothetical protein
MFKKFLVSATKQLYALQDFIKTMANIVNRSPAEKEMLLNQIRNTYLPSVIGSTTPIDPFAQQRSEQQEFEDSLDQTRQQ